MTQNEYEIKNSKRRRGPKLTNYKEMMELKKSKKLYYTTTKLTERPETTTFKWFSLGYKTVKEYMELKKLKKIKNRYRGKYLEKPTSISE